MHGLWHFRMWKGASSIIWWVGNSSIIWWSSSWWLHATDLTFLEWLTAHKGPGSKRIAEVEFLDVVLWDLGFPNLTGMGPIPFTLFHSLPDHHQLFVAQYPAYNHREKASWETMEGNRGEKQAGHANLSAWSLRPHCTSCVWPQIMHGV